MRILKLLLFDACVMHLASAMLDIVWMDQQCGGSQYIGSDPATRIRLTSSPTYRANMDCTFTVEGDYALEDRLMIKFQDLGVESVTGLYTESICDNDYLAIFDGPNKTYPRIGSGKFCGYSTPSIIYTSSGSSLTFYFKSGSGFSFDDSGFDIILTHFKAGPCSSDEFECGNGRCIYYSLVCNGYNPCGDNSDCKSTYGTTVDPWAFPSWTIDTAGINNAGVYTTSWSDNTGGIVGVIIGSFVFVFIIIMMVVAVQRRRADLYERPVQHVSMATVQARTVQAPMSPANNQPVPQQLQIPTATVQTMAAPPPYGYDQPLPQHSGQIHTVSGTYADQSMTSYQPPPPYSVK